MTFRSSCSYAGIANLLHFEGFETSDRDIALQMKLPYLFAKEGDAYLSGSMLQTAGWFNLYLHQIGFSLSEQKLPKSETAKYLLTLSHAMLGIRVAAGQKHAVIYCGQNNGKLQFLNHKKKGENTPDFFLFSEEELLDRLDETAMIASLKRTNPRKVSFLKPLKTSIATFTELKNEITDICHRQTSTPELKAKLNPVFRPILLDGISMLELIRQTKLCNSLTIVQKELLSALKSGEKAIRLADCLSMDLLTAAMEEYSALISAEYHREGT